MPQTLLSSDARAATELIFLDSEHENIFLLDSWWSEIRRKSLKKGRRGKCVHRRSGPDDTLPSVVFRAPPDCAIHVSPNGLALSRALADAISPHLTKHAVWGPCFLGENREPFPDYVAVYVPVEHCVFLRGVAGSTYTVCACGLPRLKSDGSESQPEYVVRHQLRAREHAYIMNFAFGILLTPQLHSRIDWGEFPGIEPHVYPVENTPLDGHEFEIDRRRSTPGGSE